MTHDVARGTLKVWPAPSSGTRTSFNRRRQTATNAPASVCSFQFRHPARSSTIVTEPLLLCSAFSASRSSVQAAPRAKPFASARPATPAPLLTAVSRARPWPPFCTMSLQLIVFLCSVEVLPAQGPLPLITTLPKTFTNIHAIARLLFACGLHILPLSRQWTVPRRPVAVLPRARPRRRPEQTVVCVRIEKRSRSRPRYHRKKTDHSRRISCNPFLVSCTRSTSVKAIQARTSKSGAALQ